MDDDLLAALHDSPVPALAPAAAVRARGDQRRRRARAAVTGAGAAVLVLVAATGYAAVAGSSQDDALRPAGPVASDAPAPSSPPTVAPLPSDEPLPSPTTGSSPTPRPPRATSTAPGPSTPPFPGNTEPDTEAPTGLPLSVTSVRVARQDGFDRVVFELGGRDAGAPGWRVFYTDDPRAQGSGDQVEVRGGAVLQVLITGVGVSQDTGATTDASDDPALPGDLTSVQDVHVGSTFEGEFEAFIGVSSTRAFTVRRLADPARVVVDVAH